MLGHLRRVALRVPTATGRRLFATGLATRRLHKDGLRVSHSIANKHHPYRFLFANLSTEASNDATDAEAAETTKTDSPEAAGPRAVAKDGSQRSRHSFQAETSQLLDIVSRSLYTDKEVFIRELISNASDALEKVRHRSVAGEPVEDAEAELQINITVDPEARTITIQDTGIGLSEDELHECLGTIAKSGTKAFMQAASASGASGVGESLIGQFGVGFYSAFMVADSVDVFSKSANPEEGPRLWSSIGTFACDNVGRTSYYGSLVEFPRFDVVVGYVGPSTFCTCALAA